MYRLIVGIVAVLPTLGSSMPTIISSSATVTQDATLPTHAKNSITPRTPRDFSKDWDSVPARKYSPSSHLEQKRKRSLAFGQLGELPINPFWHPGSGWNDNSPDTHNLNVADLYDLTNPELLAIERRLSQMNLKDSKEVHDMSQWFAVINEILSRRYRQVGTLDKYVRARTGLAVLDENRKVQLPIPMGPPYYPPQKKDLEEPSTTFVTVAHSSTSSIVTPTSTAQSQGVIQKRGSDNSWSCIFWRNCGSPDIDNPNDDITRKRSVSLPSTDEMFPADKPSIFSLGPKHKRDVVDPELVEEVEVDEMEDVQDADIEDPSMNNKEQANASESNDTSSASAALAKQLQKRGYWLDLLTNALSRYATYGGDGITVTIADRLKAYVMGHGWESDKFYAKVAAEDLEKLKEKQQDHLKNNPLAYLYQQLAQPMNGGDGVHPAPHTTTIKENKYIWNYEVCKERQKNKKAQEKKKKGSKRPDPCAPLTPSVPGGGGAAQPDPKKKTNWWHIIDKAVGINPWSSLTKRSLSRSASASASPASVTPNTHHSAKRHIGDVVGALFGPFETQFEEPEYATNPAKKLERPYKPEKPHYDNTFTRFFRSVGDKAHEFGRMVSGGRPKTPAERKKIEDMEWRIVHKIEQDTHSHYVGDELPEFVTHPERKGDLSTGFHMPGEGEVEPKEWDGTLAKRGFRRAPTGAKMSEAPHTDDPQMATACRTLGICPEKPLIRYLGCRAWSGWCL